MQGDEFDNCGGCGKRIADDEMATMINPSRGYGRPAVIACDKCMVDKFADWRAEHWPTWPELRKIT